jgi:cell division initiation protein
MTLSPLDIRRQQFTKALRGYEPAEVDAFLKQVSDQQEALLDDVRRAEERTRDAEAKLLHYEKVELALQEALETARATARRAEGAAEERAQIIVEQAGLQAERIVRDAERERDALRQDVDRLAARQTEVAARLRGLLLSELEVLAEFQKGARAEPAGPQATDPQPPGPQPAEPQPAEPQPAEPEAADWRPTGAPAPPSGPPEARPGDAAEGVPGAGAAAGPFDEPPAFSDDAADPLAAPLDAGGGASPAGPPPENDDARGPEPEPAELTAEPTAEPPSPPERAPEPSRAVTGGWDLRSLVAGGEGAASAAERERIRRILDDLD